MNTVTSKDGTTIACDISGAGPALILVGGALSDRSATPPLATLLAPHFTVIAYDRRGRGDSTDTAPYAVEREIEDIDALISESGGAAYAFGLSSGAVLALEAAAHGLAISKLALYEPPFMIDPGRQRLPVGYAAHLGELLAAGRRGDAVEYFMVQAVEVPAAMVADMRQSPMWPALEAVAPTLLYDQAVMDASQQGTALRAEVMASVKADTLVMAGGASPAWMRNAAEATARAIPGAQYRVFAGQTHAITREAPDVLAQTLVEFFSA